MGSREILEEQSRGAGFNPGPLVPQTSAYSAPTNRVKRVLPSENGWNETYTPGLGIA